MDLIDFLWNYGQDCELDDLRGQIDRMRGADDASPARLARENLELKLRLGLLVRLLIKKGVIHAEEYAALITQTRAASGDSPASS